MWSRALAIAAVSIGLIWGAGAPAQANDVSVVRGPAFSVELPNGWTALWYDALNSILASPDTSDPDAPSLLVGFGDGADRLEEAALAKRLGELISDRGAFTAVLTERGVNGDYAIFKNESGDLRVAVWLETFGGARRPAVALLAAPVPAFRGLDAEAMVKRVAKSVRPIEGPRRAVRDLKRFLGKPLVAIDAEPYSDAAGPLGDFLLILSPNGAAERFFLSHGAGGAAAAKGIWTHHRDGVNIAWTDRVVRVEATEKAPQQWYLTLSPEGLRTPSTVLRPARRVREADLRGRLLLQGASGVSVRPRAGGAALDVARIDFGAGGRFSAASRDGRSAGGVYKLSERSLTLSFYDGGRSQHFIHWAEATGAAGAMAVIDGRAFVKDQGG